MERDLADLRKHATVCSPRLDGAPRQNGVSDPTYQKTADIMQLERRIAETKRRIAVLKSFIDNIPDAQERLIARLHCERRYSWARIAAEVGGGNTEESVRKRFERMFKK